MKKTIVALVCFASFGANAQKLSSSKVPVGVKAAFSKTFPKVNTVKWEKENNGFEANFKENGKATSAVFDASGNWQETERAIPIARIPAAAKVYLNAHYAGKKIKEAAELKLADGTTNFEAEVDGMDIIFDGNGKFLRTAKD